MCTRCVPACLPDVFPAQEHDPCWHTCEECCTLIACCLSAVFVSLLKAMSCSAGTLFEERGSIMTVFIVCYALTSFVGGYVSGGYFARNDGKNWIKAMVATATAFPLTFFGIASILNTIAIVYHSLAAVSRLGHITCSSHANALAVSAAWATVPGFAAQSDIMCWQLGIKLGAGKHWCFTAGYFSLLLLPDSLLQGS